MKCTIKRKTRIIALSTALLSLSMAPLSHAVSTEAKQGASFFTSSIVGAVAGGPIGFVIGAIGGAYMGEQIKKADDHTQQSIKLEQSELALSESRLQVSNLRNELHVAQLQADDMQELAISSLKFQVMFRTGQDQLSERSRERITTLAGFLKQYPNLRVRLEGHADPRGTDAYNNVLSDYRNRNVENDLLAAGVSPERIERVALGSNASVAPKGDIEAYAMERRVNIEIYNPAQQASVALH